MGCALIAVYARQPNSAAARPFGKTLTSKPMPGTLIHQYMPEASQEDRVCAYPASKTPTDGIERAKFSEPEGSSYSIVCSVQRVRTTDCEDSLAVFDLNLSSMG